MNAPASPDRHDLLGSDLDRVRRWECHCRRTPVLLGIYDDTGCINIKIRDRYWRVTRGSVETICPRCGTPHVLDSARLPPVRHVPA